MNIKNHIVIINVNKNNSFIIDVGKYNSYTKTSGYSTFAIYFSG